MKIAISYSHKDHSFKKELLKHLSVLQQETNIEIWHDLEINPGKEWDETIKLKFYDANIILLLISADFFGSQYINDVELPIAIKNHNEGKTKVIPIFTRVCEVSEEIKKLQGLPRDMQFIGSSQNRDELYFTISKEIRKEVIKHMELNDTTDEDCEKLYTSITEKKIRDLINLDKIFLAIPPKKHLKKWKYLYHYIKGMKNDDQENWEFDVLPHINDIERISALSSEDQSTEIEQMLDQCLYSIHFIDLYDDSTLMGIQYEQSRIRCADDLHKCLVYIDCINEADTFYKLINSDFKVNSSIQQIAPDEDIMDRLELLVDEQEQKKKRMIDGIKSDKAAFILYSKDDEHNQDIIKIEKNLQLQDYSVLKSIPGYTEDGVNPKEYEESKLSECDVAIVVYANAQDNWFYYRQGILLGKKNLKVKMVYIDDPFKNEKKDRIINDVNYQILDDPSNFTIN